MKSTTTTRKAFDFVEISEVPPKPRNTGVIEIRGPYYAPTTLGYVKDLLEMWGDYIDGFKFAGGSMRLLSVDMVKSILKVCHDHDVEIVKQVKKMGMIPKPEISLMIGAGAGTHMVGYKPKLRSIDDLMKEARAHLKAGAHIMMLESEGITEDLPPSKWRTDVIKKLVTEFGFESWMFESSDPPVFKWYLKNFGSNVNLFIDHSQIVEYTAWRTKLWGDPEIWKGKTLSYKSKKE